MPNLSTESECPDLAHEVEVVEETIDEQDVDFQSEDVRQWAGEYWKEELVFLRFSLLL